MPSVYRVWRSSFTGSFYLSYILVSLYPFILNTSHIMRIISFGDSFTAGFNKSLDGSERWFLTPYIQIIADRLNADFINHAETGNCNPRIATQVNRWFSRGNYEKGDLVFIGWSGLLREFSFDPEYGWSGRADDQPIASEEERLWTSQYAMRGTENLLRSNGIPHIMTGAFITPEYVKEEKWQCWIESTKASNTIYDICLGKWLKEDKKKPYWWTFNGRDKRQRDLRHGEPWGHQENGDTDVSVYLNECCHPNEKGHQKIADTLYPYIADVATFTPKSGI